MAQIKKKFIAPNSVDGSKIQLENDEALRGRNQADSADVEILKVNTDDRIEFSSVPQSPSDASAPNDLVRYSQLGGLIDGMKPKAAVAIASEDNIDLSVAADPSPIDGYTLVNGDRILLWGQTAPEENGIYDAVDAEDPTTWTRSSDFNSPSEIPGSYTVSMNGTEAQGQLYVCLSSPATVGSDPIEFAIREISVASYTGGDMVTLTGNAFSVDLASTSGLESTNPGNAAGQLRVKLEASNPSLQISGGNELGVKLDSAGAVVKGAGGVAVAVDGTTIEIRSNALQVKDGGIGEAKLADESVSEAKLQDDSVSEAKLQDDSVSEAKLQDDSVSEAKLQDDSVSLDKLQAESVDENKIVDTALDSAGALQGGSGSKIGIRVDSDTVKINGSNNLESLKETEEKFTLNGTNITNQYIDLAQPAHGADASTNSISLYAVGGPMQEKGVDYTVSLTGGAGGVTRITFAGDLATGGAAALVASDKLVVRYSYL